MDYVEMLKDPELIYGFQELVGDADAVVVKRTVKVFTSVYYHSLRLLAEREIDVDVILSVWPSVKGVVDKFMAMVNDCENEGVLIQLLRFLEVAVSSHLTYDLTQFPEVFEKGRDVVKTGLRALKNLVATPYIGGSSFIVGVRALITIACLRPDLLEPVTNFLNKQLPRLPPTLFDHNVRSLNMTLQRNLFRLLRRAESPSLKEKLIEMMVSAGVPRKNILAWAPQGVEPKKRSIEAISDDSIVGRITPPEKKARLDNPNDGRYTPEDDGAMVIEPRPPAEDISSSSKNFVFFSDLQSKSGSVFDKKVAMYDKLDLRGVIQLVLEGLKSLPEEEPSDFLSKFKKLGKISNDIEEMRDHLALLLTKDLSDEQFKSSLGKGTPFKKSSPGKLPEQKVSSSLPVRDIDMRELYIDSRSVAHMGDVDMRVKDPRLVRDPRLMRDPRLLKDFKSGASSPPPKDPRLQESLKNLGNRSSEMVNTDPSLRKPESRQRKTRWDARDITINTVQNGLVITPHSFSIDPRIRASLPLPIVPQIQDQVFPRSPLILDSRFRHPLPATASLNLKPNFNPPFQFGAQVPTALPILGGFPFPSSPMQHPQIMANGPTPFGWFNQLPNSSLVVAQTLGPGQSGVIQAPLMNL